MSDPANPYRAPGADVHTPMAVNLGGSIEATLAGQGQLDLGATMGEAWERTKGSKTIIFGGFLLSYLILLPLQFIVQQFIPTPQTPEEFANAGPTTFAIAWLANLMVTFLAYPLFAGVFMTGARHVSGLPIRFSELFAQYQRMPTFILVSVLQTLLIMVGFMLLLLPGIYLSVAYMLAFPLIADRGMGAWEAMETSRKLVTKHWFTVFFLLVLVGVLTGLSAIFLLIPLIWTLPWMILCMGIVYRNLAGVQSR
jgi:hypothetical protein